MIGVNIYGLIDNLQKDIAGTFRSIAQAGFDEVELLVLLKKKQRNVPIGIAAQETLPYLIAEAKKNGLSVRSVHVFGNLSVFLTPCKKIARYFEKLHNQYGIQTFVFSGMFRDEKGARKWARLLKHLSETISIQEIKILYHNHSQEFEMIQIGSKKMSAMDYFLSLAGEKIGLQLDIGWTGVYTNEMKIAKKYSDRIVAIHLKDFIAGTKGTYTNDNMPKDRFCAIGNGEIQTDQILAMCDAFPSFNGSVIIDQDHSAVDILEDVRTGYQNIRLMLQNEAKAN